MDDMEESERKSRVVYDRCIKGLLDLRRLIEKHAGPDESANPMLGLLDEQLRALRILEAADDVSIILTAEISRHLLKLDGERLLSSMATLPSELTGIDAAGQLDSAMKLAELKGLGGRRGPR